MKNLRKIALGSIPLLLAVSLSVNAQDTTSTFDRQAEQNGKSNYDAKPGKSKFMMRGYYHTGFENVTVGDDSDSKFNTGNILIIFVDF